MIRSASRLTWPPQPGYFSMRLCRGGYRVPARIEILAANGEGPELWRVTVDGTALTSADPVTAGADRVWHSGEMIAEWEYLDMLDFKARMQRGDPDHPCLHPRKKVSPMTMRPLTIRRRDLLR